MCIEYNECHYGGMYNVYVKRKIFIITEIVRMIAGASSEKEKVKESQSRSVTPPLDIHFGCRVGGVTGRHVSDQCFDTPASATTLLLRGQTRL